MKPDKSKGQIERDYPLFKPDEASPFMEWIAKRDEANFVKWLGMVRGELKPVARFMKIAGQNRLWLIILTLGLTMVIVILWIHIKMVTS